MALCDVIGEEAFAIATEYGRTMHLQHNAHVWAWNSRRVTPFYDSELVSTRRFWWMKFYNATEAEAADPAPFAEVLRRRIAAMLEKKGTGHAD